MLTSLSIVSILNVFYCVRSGIADANTLSLRSELEEYERIGKRIDPLAWSQLMTGIDKASILAADVPQYYEEKAYLYAVRGVQALKFPDVAAPVLLKAKANYIAALSARPMSSAIWANLALIKYYLANPDDEIERLVDIALLYGLNDPKTLAPVIFLEVSRWDRLTKIRKFQIYKAFQNTQGPFKTQLNGIYRDFPQEGLM